MNLSKTPTNIAKLQQLSQQIKIWGKELGFADIGITDTDLAKYESSYFKWLAKNFHGEMDYMSQHGTKRTRPDELEPDTLSIISCRMNYFDPNSFSAITQLQNTEKAYISRYALNKDYHKLIRKRLQQLANKIEQSVSSYFPNLKFRCFTDSAPVLERAIAEKSGLGFTGKNSLIIHPKAGSWFFLGEIYLNLKLPKNAKTFPNGCGSCTACIQECPTQAIVADGVVDARRCISYLTIEFKGSIDESLRSLMGNRIYGCDDCQLVCPWNHFTQETQEIHFKASPHELDSATLADLLLWSEKEFLKKLEGSPIRRIGHEQWQRNICIALGNTDDSIKNKQQALQTLMQFNTSSILVKEHRDWAIKHLQKNHNLDEFTSSGKFHTLNKPAKAKKYYLNPASAHIARC